LKLLRSSFALCRPDSNVAFTFRRSDQIKDADDNSSFSLFLVRLLGARSK